LRGDRARLLVAAGARQPSKKLAQVVIGNERAPAKLAGDELAGANGAVNSVAAKVGRSADFVDRICEPAFAAGDLRFAFHEEASFRLPTQSDGQRKGSLLICLRINPAVQISPFVVPQKNEQNLRDNSAC
jgi:hypothetical protein